VNQFIQDMIHLTEGEKLIKYWWLWLLIVFVALPFSVWYFKNEDKKFNRKMEFSKSEEDKRGID
jgi:hypothetical protein